MQIGRCYWELVDYIATYLRLHQDATPRTVVEELILSYGKQLLPGIPEELWASTMKQMINACQDDLDERTESRLKNIRSIQARARNATNKAKRLREEIYGQTKE